MREGRTYGEITSTAFGLRLALEVKREGNALDCSVATMEGRDHIRGHFLAQHQHKKSVGGEEGRSVSAVATAKWSRYNVQ